MTRPACALVDPQALLSNLDRVRHFAPQARCMAVVKADGYGHGLEWVATTLAAQVDGFAVASLEEGLQLRQAGLANPVCLLSGFFEAAELPELARHRLAPVIHHDKQLSELTAWTSRVPLDVWLKLDTGMHRIGFSPARFNEVLSRLQAHPSVGVIRLMSHFANADDAQDPATHRQTQAFLSATDGAGLERSLANSAGICQWPASHLEWVRPGLMLYGASPLAGAGADSLGLKPVMTLSSRLVTVQRLSKGDRVGYGGDWVCPEDMPVGVVAMGYGDGYPRHAPAGTPLLVNNRRVPLIGRVSMDMLTVDLRSQPQAAPGDPAVLWGRGLPVDEIAALAGTIAYELLCGVTSRIKRDVVGAGQNLSWPS